MTGAFAVATAGITDRDELVRLSGAAIRDRRIATSTFGVGADFDERLLHGMADAAGGHFYLIEHPAQIPDLLTGELGELIAVLLGTLFAACGADFAYVNFDDERLAPPLDLDELLTALVQVYGETRTFFFDEIQNAANWVLFVNRLQRRGYNIVLTGSNAHLLNRELSTHLTGRYREFRLLLCSFPEYLAARSFMENMVAVELFRRSSEYYAHKTSTGQEVDFLLRCADGPDRLLQVCYDLSDPKTRRREFKALATAGSELGLSGGTVLTWDEEGTESVGGFPLELVPSWKWLLGMDKGHCP